MGEPELLRRMLRIAVRDSLAETAGAEAIVSFYEKHADFLGFPALKKPDAKKSKKKKQPPKQVQPVWDQVCAAITQGPLAVADEPKLQSFALINELGAVLDLAPADAALLQIAVAVNRSRRVRSLAYFMHQHCIDEAELVAELAGFETLDDARLSAPFRLGLVRLHVDRSDAVQLGLGDPVYALLRKRPNDRAGLIAALVGPTMPASLSLDEFSHMAGEVALVLRLLKGAVSSGATGVNILFHGPPGTGKTELAKALAAGASADLIAIGEADEDGDEPTRWDRVTALQLAQRALAGRGNTVLLFDEMEDFIGNTERADHGGYFSQREGSKVFINRTLETNPVPVIWTTNALGAMDPAFVRRMSYVAHFRPAPLASRKPMMRRIADQEGLNLSGEVLDDLAALPPEIITVSRSAFRSAVLAGGKSQDAGAIARALSAAIEANGETHYRGKPIDLKLYNADQSVAGLIDRLGAKSTPDDFRVLLTGPPGTGKTALAGHIAYRLGRPLQIATASSLLSKWIGETEKNIAETFAQARRDGAVLLFDEIDSVLQDRANATRSWEVTQVNELLTALEQHTMPFVAATNHGQALDSAALRRFDFKLALEPLAPDQLGHAFRVFFGREAPPSLALITGLTPGDFATVARQVRFEKKPPQPAWFVAALTREARAKPERLGRIGFHLAAE